MRTKGSGWGAGTILYQVCPLCLKKKAFYDYDAYHPFRCTNCKEHFSSLTLLRVKYVSQLSEVKK